MFFPKRTYKQKHDRDMIDQYVRRFYNRKTLIEISTRLGVKISYIKHRIHALNLAPYREDKIPIVNKRPYKDYVQYNYAEKLNEVIGHIKFVYSDPDIPFSEWTGFEEVENQLLQMLNEAHLPAFTCNYQKISCTQKRKDMFL